VHSSDVIVSRIIFVCVYFRCVTIEWTIFSYSAVTVNLVEVFIQ